MAVDRVGKMEATLLRVYRWFRRPLIMRYTLLVLHATILCVYFVLVILHGVFLFIPGALGILFALVYCPTAVVVACRRSKRAFDRTGAEVAYLSIQSGLWLSIVILGLHFRGPSYCADLNYQLGLFQSFDPGDLDGNASNAVLDSCDIDTALNVLSCLHLLLLIVWLVWIIRRTKRIDMERDQAFKCSTWRMLKGEYPEKVSATKEENGLVPSRDHSSTQAPSTTPYSTISPSVHSSNPTHSTLYDSATGSGNTSNNATYTGPGQSLPPGAIAIPIIEEPPPAYIDSATSPSRSTAGTMTIEDFMRNQQHAMEEKLAMERQERARQLGLGRGQASRTALGEGSSSGVAPRRRLSY